MNEESVPPEQPSREPLGRLLLDAHRAYSTSGLAALRERGYDGLTLAHARMIVQLDVGGAQIGELAERSGVTKQAAAALVRELEIGGFVIREVDPEDRRASWVTPTGTGWGFRRAASEVFQYLDDRWTRALDGDESVQLRTLLARAFSQM